MVIWSGCSAGGQAPIVPVEVVLMVGDAILRRWAMFALCLAFCACSSDEADSEMGDPDVTGDVTDDMVADDVTDADEPADGTDAAFTRPELVQYPSPGAPIVEDCLGLDFDGMLYSPGGTDLPNNCESFHPTWNNPYAVLCTDAWPWYETEFPGDRYCILPPDPEMGIQVGMHPQGNTDVWFEQVSQGDMSGYEDLADEWIMEGGEEEEFNYQGGSDSPEFDYYRNSARMRPGSHHMINSTSDPNKPQGE